MRNALVLALDRLGAERHDAHASVPVLLAEPLVAQVPTAAGFEAHAELLFGRKRRRRRVTRVPLLVSALGRRAARVAATTVCTGRIVGQCRWRWKVAGVVGRVHGCVVKVARRRVRGRIRRRIRRCVREVARGHRRHIVVVVGAARAVVVVSAGVHGVAGGVWPLERRRVRRCRRHGPQGRIVGGVVVGAQTSIVVVASSYLPLCHLGDWQLRLQLS